MGKFDEAVINILIKDHEDCQFQSALRDARIFAIHYRRLLIAAGIKLTPDDGIAGLMLDRLDNILSTERMRAYNDAADAHGEDFFSGNPSYHEGFDDGYKEAVRERGHEVSEAYEKGRRDGYKKRSKELANAIYGGMTYEKFQEIFQKGFDAGFDKGYASHPPLTPPPPSDEELIERDNSYSEGHSDGYAVGFRDGKEVGYKEGYNDGLAGRSPTYKLNKK